MTRLSYGQICYDTWCAVPEVLKWLNTWSPAVASVLEDWRVFRRRSLTGRCRSLGIQVLRVMTWPHFWTQVQSNPLLPDLPDVSQRSQTPTTMETTATLPSHMCKHEGTCHHAFTTVTVSPQTVSPNKSFLSELLSVKARTIQHKD